MKTDESKVSVSLHEIGTFIAYATIISVIAVGMYADAPEGLGQILGVTFAVALLPVPAVVLYFTRWREESASKRVSKGPLPASPSE